MNKKTIIMLITLIAANPLLSIWLSEFQNKIEEKEQQINDNRLEREENRKAFLERMTQRIDKKLEQEPDNATFIDQKNDIKNELDCLNKNSKLMTEMYDLHNKRREEHNKLMNETVNNVYSFAKKGAMIGGGLALTIITIYALKK